MSVVGISLVRDEADIIGPVIEHMLDQVDRVIVADNLSSDGTSEILAAYPIDVIEDDEPAHYQSRKMTALAQRAAEEGATWAVPFDADEVWYSPFGRLGDVLEGIEDQWLCASATMFDHVATGSDVADDANPLTRMTWRRRAHGFMPKVACRLRPDLVIHEGNHGASYDGGPTTIDGQLVIRHFPYRSAEQFVAKAAKGSAALAATDLPDAVGLHWRRYGELLRAQGPEALTEAFRQHFWVAFPELDEGVVLDPVQTAVHPEPEEEVIEHRAWGKGVIRETRRPAIATDG